MRAGATAGIAPLAEQRIGAVIGMVAGWLAYVGGLVLVATAAMTIASIVGRALARVVSVPVLGVSLGPVRGDYELVAAGCAIAVFAFLPYCQFHRGNITVDMFFAKARPRTIAFTSLIGNVLLTAAAALIAWRLQAGMIDRYTYGETSYILQFPMWWGFAGALVGAWAFAVVGLYTAWRSYNEWQGEGETLTSEISQ